MEKKENSWKRLTNKYKSMSKKKLIIHILTVLISLACIGIIIYSAISVNDVHDFYLHHTEEWFNNNVPPIIDGKDYSQILNNFPDKGPEAISWYLTAGDNKGFTYYILVIIFGILSLPTLIYTISFFLVTLFPKKNKKEENQDENIETNKKSKRKRKSKSKKSKNGGEQ